VIKSLLPADNGSFYELFSLLVNILTDRLLVVERSKFSHADFAVVVYGGVVVGQHVVHQRPGVQSRARLVCILHCVNTFSEMASACLPCIILHNKHLLLLSRGNRLDTAVPF